jgi:hypothetical protein
MPHRPQKFTLMPQQTHMIHAKQGFRLEVRSGCLWLTRPGDRVDRFFFAGAVIDLHENHVLIQGDRQPGTSRAVPASYTLVPLPEPEVARSSLFRRFWQGAKLTLPPCDPLRPTGVVN